MEGSRLTSRLRQLPVPAIGRPGQPGPGRNDSRRDGAGAASGAETRSGTTRSAVPRRGADTLRARLSRHQRSQSAIRLPVEMAPNAPMDGVPNNVAGSLDLE